MRYREKSVKKCIKKEKKKGGGSIHGNYNAQSDGSTNHRFALPNAEPLWHLNMFYSPAYHTQ